MPSSSSVKPNSIIRKQLSPDLRKTYSLGSTVIQQDSANSRQWIFSAITGTTSNITLDGTVVTLNGIPLNNGDIVLVKDQTDLSENGLYEVSSTGWNRVDEFLPGCIVVLREGGEDIEDTVYIFASDGVNIGVDDIEFKRLPNTTVTNIGASGIGVFKEMTEEEIRLKNIAANSAKIILYDDLSNDIITIDVDPSEINLNDLGEKSYNNLTDKPTIDSFILDTTNFNNNLSELDDTPQKAFETLDELETSSIPPATTYKIPFHDGVEWRLYDGVYIDATGAQLRLAPETSRTRGLTISGQRLTQYGIVIGSMGSGTTCLFNQTLGNGLYVQSGERAFAFTTYDYCYLQQNDHSADILYFVQNGRQVCKILQGGQLFTEKGLEINHTNAGYNGILINHLAGSSGYSLVTRQGGVETLRIMPQGSINAADEIYSQKQIAIGAGANAGAGDTSLIKYSNKDINSGGDDETNVYQFKGEYDNTSSGTPYNLEIFDQGVASQRLTIPLYTTAMVEMKVVAYTYMNGVSGHASWNIHAMIYRQAGNPVNAGEVIVSTVQLGGAISIAPTLNIVGSNIQLICQVPNNMFTRYSADLIVKNITGGF